MKHLLIGDPHATVEELADVEALFAGIDALLDDVDFVWVLGDLHHNHALVRVEVTSLWLRVLTRLGARKPVYVLKGNHDGPNDQSVTAHALEAYKGIPGVTVIDSPTVVLRDILALPYCFTTREFVDSVAKFRTPQTKALICHQTFDGSRFENGFYAPDGVKPEDVGIPIVISGHIHSSQTLMWAGGRVDYVGSPRWRTLSDANVEKAVVIWDSAKDQYQAINTAAWCLPIRTFEVSDVSELVDVGKCKMYVTVKCTPETLVTKTAEIKARFPNAFVRPSIKNASRTVNITESEGVFNALRRYVASYKPLNGTPYATLSKMVAERVL